MHTENIGQQHLYPVLIPGQRPPPHLREHYDSAFKMWCDTWLSAFSELDGANRIFSDDFKRQDEVLVLFHGKEAAASVFFSHINLKNEEDRLDSYFKPWPQELLKSLGDQKGQNGLICSYFTVAKNWRKAEFPFYAKDIIGALAIMRFLELQNDMMVGTMRNNKGMNNIAYSLGADPFIKNVMHHGVDVDLVQFLPNKVNYSPVSGMKPFIENLWSKLLTYEQLRSAA